MARRVLKPVAPTNTQFRQLWDLAQGNNRRVIEDHNYRLWLLLNIEVFWRHFVDGETVSDLEGWIDSSRETLPA